MVEQTSNDLMIGREVYQLIHLMDMDETVLMTTLDENKVDDLLAAVESHDKKVPNHKGDELEKWEAAHPLDRWRTLLMCGGKFSDPLPCFERKTWESSLIKTTFTLE